jgi:acyl-coenzyme A synthetase/AMP-(fatty) acid ligase/acyl carrier protein
VVNFLASMRSSPGLTAGDALLAVTTLSFDIAVLELYLPLWVGARIVLAQGDEVGDGNALAMLIRRHAVTVMQATPSTWQLLLEAGFDGGAGFTALVGGEAVPRELAQALRARCGRVVNMYGPTETTVWSTCYAFPEGVPRVLIGRPIGNTTTWVLDARMQPVPIGVPGELFIGGDGVAIGYLNRPELTAERFVSAPALGGRLYRTGDVVRLLADGNLEYLRRNDTQVKVRGHRIELGEIEAALGSHPAVARAIVVVVTAQPGDVRLAAYVTARPGRAFTESELRKHLMRMLPAYMLPQHVLELDELPLTPNGKIDRKRLPAIQREELSEEAYAPPVTAREIRLAELWSEALHVQRVGQHDNFFNLGGHSLMALRLLTRIEREFGVKVSPRVLLLSTLTQVAAQLPAPGPVVPAAQPDRPQAPSLFGRLVSGLKSRLS